MPLLRKIARQTLSVLLLFPYFFEASIFYTLSLFEQFAPFPIFFYRKPVVKLSIFYPHSSLSGSLIFSTENLQPSYLYFTPLLLYNAFSYGKSLIEAFVILPFLSHTTTCPLFLFFYFLLWQIPNRRLYILPSSCCTTISPVTFIFTTENP